ncbi:MAG TPA: HAD-IB family phosphatase [Opitutaceae bacterium]
MKLVCFDCDSTLSGIEGIDELARQRGPEAFAAVEAMTNDAMNGKIPIESIFARRLEIIQPTQASVAAVGQRYLEEIEPDAKACVAELKAQGWTPVIVSAGFVQAIQPLADALGISDIEAVPLIFDVNGAYRDFDRAYPTTRSGGKPVVVRRLKERFHPARVAAVGDGVSDLETQSDVDLFVGFGRYVARPRVQTESAAFITSLRALPGLLA